MLILKRTPGTGIVITLEDGRQIVVVQRDCERWGIEAPKSVRVLRDELVQREGDAA